VVERSFALILDRGGMRRAWLRGRENLHKRLCGRPRRTKRDLQLMSHKRMT
jgi:hypothetical protein